MEEILAQSRMWARVKTKNVYPGDGQESSPEGSLRLPSGSQKGVCLVDHGKRFYLKGSKLLLKALS